MACSSVESRVAKRLFISLCIIVAAVFPAYSQLSAPETPLREADKLIASGRIDEALQKLEALAIQDPEPPGVEFVRGMAFYQKGGMMQAAAAFAKAVSQDPANLDAMQMQGVSLFRAGRPSEAVPLLERANKSVPNVNVDPNYVLGLCYIDTQRYDDARKALAGQYGFAPDSAQAYLLLARMLLRHDHLPVAEESARKALSLSPNLLQAHFLLGQLALAHGQYADAIAHFEREHDLDPLNGAVYDRLGDTYIRNGDFVHAQQALNRAVLLEPTVSVPFILLGKVLLKQQNPLMARMYLEHALQMDPNSSMAHYLLGQAYGSLGRADDAAREYHATERIQAANEPHFESIK
jgi:tetratricopeptide (TPR) repeat protein